jgi:hypothetical protein
VREAGRLVVEITLDAAALDWRAPQLVTAIFADGSTATWRVDRSKTTRDGWVDTGLTIRLGIEVPQGAGELDGSVLQMSVGGVPLEVAL